MISEVLSYLFAYRNIFISLLLARFIYNKYGHGISKYPGPFIASLTNWWRFYDVAVNNHVPPMLDLHRKYGKIVRYGPNMLSFSDPRAINDIYVGSDAFIKSNYYAVDDIYIQGVKHQTMFSTRDERWHGKMKRAVGPAFSMTSVAGLEKYVDDTIAYFMTVISTRFVDTPSAKPLNLLTWVQYFAFDVLGQLMWGERHGCIERGTDVDSIIGVATFASTYSYIIGQVPWLDNLFFKNPLMILATILGLVDSTYAVFSYAEKQIKTKKGRIHVDAGDEGSGADLLDRMLALQQKNPELLSDIEIQKICAMLVFAGSDTTAITISTLLYNLIRNPTSYATLQTEIDIAMPGNSTSILFSRAQSLPYLDACIKEIFRLHPATGFNLERIVPAGGRKVAGEFIPGGTIVSVSDWALHRDSSIFGEYVDSFKPERWLGDEDKTNEMARNMFHFGAGISGCIGRNVALLEIYKLVPVILKIFKMELVDPHKGGLETYNMSFVKPVGLNVTLTRR